MDLTGRLALITGAGGGIGRATARRFAEAGADLHLVDIDEASLAETAGVVEQLGRRATGSVADVSLPDDVRGYVDAAVREHGRIDAFFNNAGIEGAVSGLAEYDVDTFIRVINVNLIGVFLGLRFVLPVMLEQGAGAIVNTGSVASERGLPGSGPYIAAKHGVLGLTRLAASEVAGRGVRVNAVLPGMIDTRMLRDLATLLSGDVDQGMEFLATVAPAGRTGNPEEVAAGVVFLCSDDASFLHGVGLPIDGGALAVMSNGTAPPVG